VILALALACGKPDPDDTGPESHDPWSVNFLVEPEDLGAPKAPASGFDPANGDALGLAMSQVLPVYGDANPAWNTPFDVWEILQLGTVQDESVCPRTDLEGDTTLWASDCRSSQGYEFSGTASLSQWEDDIAERIRFEVQMEVLGDVESALFERILLDGVLQEAIPFGEEVVIHLDLNLHIEVEGYWEQRGPSDPRLEAWRAWTASGSVEESPGRWSIDMAVDIAESGGFHVRAPRLDADSACPVELSGEAALAETITASFAGASSCDACAEVLADGTEVSRACKP